MASRRARLLKRVLEIDLQHCPNCGRQLKIIGVILESAVVKGILAQQSLQARAPLQTPARELQVAQATRSRLDSLRLPVRSPQHTVFGLQVHELGASK